MTNSTTKQIKTIAILTRGEALSAILQMVLSVHADLRVRVFACSDDLSDFVRITPIDMLVCELGAGPDGATHLVPMINAKLMNAAPFQTIALATEADVPSKAMCERAGIDEVIFKPMSPRYLEERVLARLGAAPKRRLAEPMGPDRRRARPSRAPQLPYPLPDNVIALFGADTPELR